MVNIKNRIVPIETVIEGDLILTTKPHKDTKQTLTGTVSRILSEGKVRTLYTAEGVELGRYIIGKKTETTVGLLKAAPMPHTKLGVFNEL